MWRVCMDGTTQEVQQNTHVLHSNFNVRKHVEYDLRAEKQKEIFWGAHLSEQLGSRSLD